MNKSSIYTAEYIHWKMSEARQNNSKYIHLYDDVTIKLSTTLKLINDKGSTCRRCNLKANYFIYNTGDGAYKSNIPVGFHAAYLTRAGKYITLTKDHILPKAQSGANIKENLQVLCFNCNSKIKKNTIYYTHNDYDIVYHTSSFFSCWVSYAMNKQNTVLAKKLVSLKTELIAKGITDLSEEQLQKILNQNKIPNVPNAVNNGQTKFCKLRLSHLKIEEEPVKKLSLFGKITFYFSKKV